MRLAVHTSDESSKDEICTSWNRLLKDEICSLDRAIRFIISKEPTKEEHIEYRRNKRQQKYINVSSEACRVAYLSGVS